MTKSLGQVAYEAYAESEYDHPLRPLDKWPPSDVNGWQAAAEAVVKQAAHEVVRLTAKPERQAVIEAAKAHRQLRKECGLTDAWDAREEELYETADRLGEAVDALQEVEGE